VTRASRQRRLPAELAQQLLDRAREAREFAYAPYSGFTVGAALLAEDGRIFTGCNVENASYGLTTCAERVAIGKAASEGVREVRAVAVAGPETHPICPPCGSCRQILYEFGPEMEVVISGEAGGEPQVLAIDELLPSAFGPTSLQRRAH
jgi:cytidine deaminase